MSVFINILYKLILSIVFFDFMLHNSSTAFFRGNFVFHCSTITLLAQLKCLSLSTHLPLHLSVLDLSVRREGVR